MATVSGADDRTLRIVAFAGDGIGPEVMAPTLSLLRHEPRLSVTEYSAGNGAFQRTGRTITPEALAAAQSADGVLFGCTATPSPPPAGYESPILLLRRRLGLIANLRYCRRPGGGLDVVIIRDCAEGLYSEVEREIDDGYVADYRITRTITRRLAAVAAETAARRGGVVTVVHKANVLRHSDGLFREVAIEEIRRAGLRHDEALADAAGYHLVADPERYDVMVTTSHVGDILSDVAAAVAGGLGLVPSLTVGDGPALAEPIHGSAPDRAGTGTADPVAMILSAALLVEHLGLTGFAGLLQAAVSDHLDARDPGVSIATAAVHADIEARLLAASPGIGTASRPRVAAAAAPGRR